MDHKFLVPHCGTLRVPQYGTKATVGPPKHLNSHELLQIATNRSSLLGSRDAAMPFVLILLISFDLTRTPSGV